MIVISEVCIYTMKDRCATCVLRSPRHVEAPNWTPDGKALVLNSDGHLYNLDLRSRELVQIDTGFACKLNNDHGISPDGTTLAISDSTETGQSVIYTVPIGGGTPKLITPLAPSYWHGWSPDSARLAYVGRRRGVFEVITCPAQGGEEVLLTKGFTHCDGPDYTPDGKWIWFNAEKDGNVDLWRMRPDGADLQRMTADDHVNWFPHPSPDGECVLYLAFPTGTQGHPANLDVELKLMPSEGGPPETVQSFKGGQGTINVPCWAPDGTGFAFVRYPAVVSG